MTEEHFDEVPAIVQAWVRQLLDPQFIGIVRSLPLERIDVRLGASRGRVTRHPSIVLNGGSQELVDP